MNVAIYHQHADDVVGGAEYVVAVMAEALSAEHAVDIIHHKRGLTLDGLAAAYGTDLSGVGLCYVPVDRRASSWTNPVGRYIRERQRYRAIGEGYDLYIASIHDVPPFCPAPRGALFIHFPYFDRRTMWPWCEDGNGVRKSVRRWYARWEWSRRFGGYQVAMTCSDFSRQHVRGWWQIDPEVVYAPASAAALPCPPSNKEDLILSVGRFSTTGTSKNQLELMRAFVAWTNGGAPGWRYQSVGGLSDSAPDRAYYERVRSLAPGVRAQAGANVSHRDLERLYGAARIFWHAAGLTASDDPRLMEHFGLVTVEAMSAGCVPVVLARGGQPEIVEHGINGFLWETVDELLRYTTMLAEDGDLCARMSAAAIVRARHFSKEQFVRRVRLALRPLLP